MKRNLKALPLLGALFVACSSPPPSPVDEIVTANLTARGGLEAIQALQSIRATGMATASGGRIARVVQEIKRPGFYRLEFSSQGTTAVFAHDGKVGWHVAPMEGVFEPEPITPENHSEAGIDERELAEALSLMMFPGSVPYFVEAAGIWRELILAGDVEASPAFRAWAEVSGQGGYDEAVGISPGDE